MIFLPIFHVLQQCLGGLVIFVFLLNLKELLKSKSEMGYCELFNHYFDSFPLSFIDNSVSSSRCLIGASFNEQH